MTAYWRSLLATRLVDGLVDPFPHFNGLLLRSGRYSHSIM